ncbi:zinc finger CCCH domain-containing protein 11A [Antennarius striatus]|uniref:zinc finger CCCH domain-containing protein 11A n=1 Tax=Antennarius striatus TaxID=241820 RepID=UPI0035AF427B
MSNRGDDCYFFYYSTCTKGDSCPFRHCEAAMGSENVCNLWKDGRCFRTTCKFRHMEITKKRKEILCYWENQAAGCQKPHCAFFHEKPRYIEGLYVPPDKTGQTQNAEQPKEEPAPAKPNSPLPTAAANPQLRGVKAESQEPVPSPTHPPVVINPADDDEDEDDQISEEGDDGKFGIASRKLPKSDESLNFGVSTLEEIRLRKALKASMKRAGYPPQNPEAAAGREKENIDSFFRPALNHAGDGPCVFEDAVRPRGSMAERLGRKIPGADEHADSVRLKRSLAERLGGVVDAEPPKKVTKPIKDRLGLSAEPSATPPVESNTESKKAPSQIHIKTLDEIKLEKAAKSHVSKSGPPAASEEPHKPKTPKGSKRSVTVKDRVTTFSEIFRAKKQRKEESKPAEPPAEKPLSKSQGEAGAVAGPPSPEAATLGQVRVKTLEEIRREKAERMLAEKEKKSCDPEESSAKKPRLTPVVKLASQREKSDDVTEKPVRTQTPPLKSGVANGNDIKVKTFEEIMREKRLRRQETEEKARGSAEAEGQKRPSDPPLRRSRPADVSPTPPGSSSPSSTAADSTLPTPEAPVQKTIPLRPAAASPEGGSAKPSSAETPQKTARKSGSTPSPAKQSRAAGQGSSTGPPGADGSPSRSQKKSPEPKTDTKVRPKLNVKPSVVKPAVRVRPGQKRRGAERSAVAAVKPLNSAPAGAEETLQETTGGAAQAFPSSSSEAHLSAAVPHSPVASLDSSCSPPSEELQTVPVFTQSVGPESKPTVIVAAARESSPPAPSPALKSPPPSKSRRTSASASRSAAVSAPPAVDVFDELISEFTDEHLEGEDVDSEIGEDDLLQELSEMIDS